MQVFDNYKIDITHNCQLDPGLYDPIEKYYKNRTGFGVKIEKCWKKLTVICTWNPRLKLHCRSRYHIMNEIEQQLKLPWYNIHPLSAFRLYWEAVLCFVFLVILIVFPLGWAFTFYSHLIGPKLHYYLLVSRMVCQTISWVDIFLNFLTGYYDESDKMCFTRHKIFMNYVKSYVFACDIASNLPPIYAVNILTTSTRSSKVFIAFNLIEFLKIFRLASLMRYSQNLLWLFTRKTFYVKIAMAILFSFVLIHWSMVAILNSSALSQYFQYKKARNRMHWLAFNNLANSSKVELHAHAFLMAETMLFGAQTIHQIYSPYASYGGLELANEIVLRICAKIATIFLICLAVMLSQSMRSSKAEYHSMYMHLRQFMRHNQISKRSKRRLRDYMEFKFKNYYFEDIGFEEEIMTMKLLNLVQSMPIFNELPRSTLLAMSKCLTLEIYLPGDTVIRSSSFVNSLYFVSTGTVALYSESGIEIRHIGDGDYFGLTVLLNRETYLLNAIAIEATEIYSLDYEILIAALTPFPYLYLKLVDEALRRRQKFIETEIKYLDYKQDLEFPEIDSFNLRPPDYLND